MQLADRIVSRSKVVDTAANLALAVSGVLLCIALLPRAKEVLRPARGQAYAPGETLAWDDRRLPPKERTLLLFFKTTCPFCEASLPFYDDLARRARGGNSVQLVPLSIEEPDTVRGWLQAHHVDLGEIVRFEPGRFRVPGVPMLVLVDRDGRVIRSWVGRLKPDAQKEVRTLLFAEPAPGD